MSLIQPQLRSQSRKCDGQKDGQNECNVTHKVEEVLESSTLQRPSLVVAVFDLCQSPRVLLVGVLPSCMSGAIVGFVEWKSSALTELRHCSLFSACVPQEIGS